MSGHSWEIEDFVRSRRRLRSVDLPDILNDAQRRELRSIRERASHLETDEGDFADLFTSSRFS